MAREIPFVIYKELDSLLVNAIEDKKEEKFQLEATIGHFFFRLNIKVECDIYEEENGNIDFTFYDYTFEVDTCLFCYEDDNGDVEEDCFFDYDKFNKAIDDNVIEKYYSKMLNKGARLFNYNPVDEFNQIISEAFNYAS